MEGKLSCLVVFAQQNCVDSEEALLSMRTDGCCVWIIHQKLKPDPKIKPYAGLLLGELCQILVGAWWLVEEDLQSETSWSYFEDIAGHVRTCQMWKRWPPVCQLPSLRTLHSFYGRASPNVMHVSTNRAGRTGQANALWVLLAKSCLRTFPWPCIGHAMYCDVNWCHVFANTEAAAKTWPTTSCSGRDLSWAALAAPNSNASRRNAWMMNTLTLNKYSTGQLVSNANSVPILWEPLIYSHARLI